MSAPQELVIVEREKRPTEVQSILQVIERAATNPNVDIDKMERLLQMQERIVARDAEVAFNEAMTAAQSEMGRISTDATNPQTHSKYASYAQLDRHLRPIYIKHGFSLSFGEEDSPQPEYVRVVCFLSHRRGHTRRYHRDMPADGKGAKGGDVMTKTHAAGAAQSYGMRYLLKGIFNVAVGEADNDGNTKVTVPLPAGFEKWQADMQAKADEGMAGLSEAWEKSPADFRALATLGGDWWPRMKARAKAARHDG